MQYLHQYQELQYVLIILQLHPPEVGSELLCPRACHDDLVDRPHVDLVLHRHHRQQLLQVVWRGHHLHRDDKYFTLRAFLPEWLLSTQLLSRADSDSEV